MDSYPEQRISEFSKKCKDVGLSVTPQRLAIYKELINTNEHPSPEVIFKRVKEYHPTISPATVYKTLDTFEKVGLITKVSTLRNIVRYDSNLDRHHHLICVKCGMIEDFYADCIYSCEIPKQASTKNYEILSCTAQVRIICEECQKKDD